MDSKDKELKEIYRSLYAYAKHLDDQRKALTNLSELYNRDLEDKRIALIQRCITLIFKDFDAIGKKSREILWRKGYYDQIAITKKNWSRDNIKTEHIDKVKKLLLEGISNYKKIASKMEEIFDLDLKLWIDFSIIDDEDHGKFQPLNGSLVDKTLDSVSCALDTIHSSFLALGDLHRYFIDFKIDQNSKITREYTSKFYYEAFKINPVIGITQNQLGTLFYGRNYDLDSIYHYLYSLVCTVPFELSETNVLKLFANHSNYLDQMEPEKVDFSLRDFYARFFFAIEIFFFDKDVPEFTSFCHCVLIDLKKVLCSKTISMTDDSMFKIVSILFFCLSKLKMINSQKVYALNAFLVAVCSDLMDACIVNIEQEILHKAEQNNKFKEMYDEKFKNYEIIFKKSRAEYRTWFEAKNNATTVQQIYSRGSSSSGQQGRSQNQRSTKESQQLPNDSEDNKQLSNTATPAGGVKSSDETKDSDLKTPQSNKSKKRGVKLRRRRRKIAESDVSSCYDSESDMNSDFSSEDDDFDSDLSSNFESDFSEIDEDQFICEPSTSGGKNTNNDELLKLPNKFESGPNNIKDKKETMKFQLYDDDDDDDVDPIIVPETLSQEMNENFNLLTLNEDLDFKYENNDEKKVNANAALSSESPPQKLKYKNKYTKVDPNIIIEFCRNESTMSALKILFDWLRINHEILLGCYHSNPEFIHKMMKLLNFFNIDIFTQKIFFENEFITVENLRENISELFDNRTAIPLQEDLKLKNFDLFRSVQIPLDWEATIRDKINLDEENFIRILKMVDFGFYVCKSKKFNYQFCVKSRRFTENVKKKRESKKSGRRRELRRRNSRNGRRNEGRSRRFSERKNGQPRKEYTSNEEKDTAVEESRGTEAKCLKKGYLRSKEKEKVSSSGADEEKSENQGKEEMDKKCEIMGKLWLKNEVEVLEEKIRKLPKNLVLTPFVVVDSKALVEYTGIVKELVKCKKFIVLIPDAVLGELDDLKKRSESARNVIRWLEKEFKYGNRYLRSQRDNENLALSLIKVPRKLNREASVFLKIAQFCNYMVTNHFNGDVEFQSNAITLLSGDNLNEKKHNNFSFTGILDAIPARYDQIANFYGKLKNK
ncbi:nonsense-mediated mRNA decay factor SMG5 [Condylostylus longicornis]|uniref:nonsense-mediated mRNA decay factor SMG5 n=1 Tax=Condylostylus longicornis TaxID=2530218 RepID=UPI00244E3484|nr:nonsense-mediated mRNA decay factor SMG5 [Condylostylus longicornis]XP_055372035.1 nonsense-mediated mRNA decay factor SMG5 [Condylostylus longicornis]XP_055372036.1 nonsense-mediated mRNA decay factor SMG5 [Condylostylus longicornis]